MFSGRKSARSDAGARFAASVAGNTGVEVFSGKTGKPRVSNLRPCWRFCQRKVRARLRDESVSPRRPDRTGGELENCSARALLGGSAVPSGDANRLSASPTLFNIKQGTARSTCVADVTAADCSGSRASLRRDVLFRFPRSHEYADNHETCNDVGRSKPAQV